MECIIDVDGAGCDLPEFIKTNLQVARQEHRCCECGDTIQKGQTYEYVSGKWDGEMCTFKTCFVCLEIRENIFCSYYYEQLYENLDNSDFEANMAALNQFSPEAQQKLIEKLVIDCWDFIDVDEED